MCLPGNGITLVALVITIIVLLILAAITINLTIGQRGILTKAQEAGKNYINAVLAEQKDLNTLYSSIKIAENSEITLTTEQLDEYINAKVDEKLKTFNSTQPTGIKENTYIYGESNYASTYTITPAMSIFTLSKEDQNAMDQYVSYSSEKGYTVLKSRLVFF